MRHGIRETGDGATHPPTPSPPHPPAPSHAGLDTAAALLWTSAFLIMAMILTQASRLGPGSPVHAGNVTSIGDLTVLTADAGDQEDILAVLDRRSETLLIYGARDRRDILLHRTYDLSKVFTDARIEAGVTRRP